MGQKLLETIFVFVFYMDYLKGNSSFVASNGLLSALWEI